MTFIADIASSPHPGRPKKFTPERIDQIRNLLERGRSREEIADIIGCTMNTLAVTCSRLGISLRRPRFNVVGGYNVNKNNGGNNGNKPQPPTSPARETPVEPQQQQQQKERPPQPGRPTLSIRMEYRRQIRETALELDERILIDLILQAELRQKRIGDFIVEIIVKAIERELQQKNPGD